MKGCFVSLEGSDRLAYVYRMGRREMFERELEILPGVVTEKNLDEHRAFLRETEVIIATWNFVPFTGEEIREYFPKLRLVLYGAGTVQYFARPFLNLGIKVVSGWAANAIPVVEMAVSLVLLSNKGYFQSLLSYKKDGYKAANDLCTGIYPGNFETRVGILGIGMIGAKVAECLKQHRLELLAYDPFLSDEKAGALNLKKASLEEIFSGCQTITSHIANNEQTKNMLNYDLFKLMKDNAAFINTGRGATVVEADLVRALREKPGRTAILDVSYPEPVPEGHEFLNMPNVFLTPHIAGSSNHEVVRMADYMYDELKRFQAGEKLLYEVTLPMLETMA